MKAKHIDAQEAYGQEEGDGARSARRPRRAGGSPEELIVASISRRPNRPVRRTGRFFYASAGFRRCFAVQIFNEQETGMATAEFWYEFASTYSYPAAMRVAGLAESRGVTLAWRPFLLGPIFAAQGWRDSPFNIYPAKGRYMWRDMERICDALELPLKRPDPFPQNSLLAARVALALEGETRAEFSRRLYRRRVRRGHADRRPRGDRRIAGEARPRSRRSSRAGGERREQGAPEGGMRSSGRSSESSGRPAS